MNSWQFLDVCVCVCLFVRIECKFVDKENYHICVFAGLMREAPERGARYVYLS